MNVIDDPLLKAVASFAVNTGLRQMEIMTLKWSQISIKKHCLILDNRNNTTKSKKIRTIPHNITVLQILTRKERIKKRELLFTVTGEKLK